MKRAFVIAVCSAFAACAGVLGLSRSGPQAFPHRAHAIAGVPCTSCHVGMSANSDALHLPDTATCISCHVKPHDPAPCLTCHVAANAVAELMEAREHVVFTHAQHTAPSKGDCMRCHVGIAEGDDHLRPAMATCFNCHNHEAANNARQCSACHRNLLDTTMLPQSHLAHDSNWLQTHGNVAASSGELCQTCHREQFCAECHGKSAPTLPSTLHFADPFSPSVHRAGFTARHALEARAEPGACATCHSPDRCESCHVANGVSGTGRRSPHPPGWVGATAADNEHGREARRDPTSCASCHDGAGQSLCISCHKVGGVGGNPHPPGWSSRLPLSSMPCRLCHAIGTRP